jgi:MFS superfamily sulfate permease-like transporter
MFALDVFGGDDGFWETTIALLIHLIPVYVIIITLIIAWRWEWVATVVFSILAVLYVIWAWPRFHHWSVYVAIPGPLVIIATLFLFNWLGKKQLHRRVKG